MAVPGDLDSHIGWALVALVLTGLLRAPLLLCLAGGVAPSHDAGLAAPSGGGVAQMIKDTFVAPEGKHT